MRIARAWSSRLNTGLARDRSLLRPWPEEIGQLVDGEDTLLVVAPDHLRGHPVQQAEVIVGLGLGRGTRSGMGRGGSGGSR